MTKHPNTARNQQEKLHDSNMPADDHHPEGSTPERLQAAGITPGLETERAYRLGFKHGVVTLARNLREHRAGQAAS